MTPERVRPGSSAVAVRLARTVGRLSRVLGRGEGQALPGVVAERLDPGVMARLAGQLTGGVVLVTGTNGKTTTTQLVVAGLTAAGEHVVSNSTGSNLRQGILAALLDDCDRHGRMRSTVGVFEVDEATLRQVVPALEPRIVVVLNLFRDQLDRHAELEQVAAKIAEGLRDSGALVLLNGDDPLVADLGRSLPNDRVSYFGIEESSGLGTQGAPIDGESDRCPRCGQILQYSYVLFAQLGHYRCPAGDFRRPTVTATVTRTGAVTAAGAAGSTGTPFVTRIAGRPHAVRTSAPGTYNIYNTLAAMTACSLLGADPDMTAHALSACTPAAGRAEELRLDGRRVRLLLVKNPTGCAQVLRTFLACDPQAPALIALNDAAADGRDVSWIWDAPMEILDGRSGPVLASGSRADDLALRLRYAGVEAAVVTGYRTAVHDLLLATPPGGTAYVLATYTAMLALRRELLRTGADVRVAA